LHIAKLYNCNFDSDNSSSGEQYSVVLLTARSQTK